MKNFSANKSKSAALVLALIFCHAAIDAQVVGPVTQTFLQGAAANAQDSLNYTNVANNTDNYSFSSTPTAYDTIDDSTGLRRENAPPPNPALDLADFFISSNLTVIQNGTNPVAATSQDLRLNPGPQSRIQSNHAYDSNATVLNPGTLIHNRLFVQFGSHLSVTALTVRVSSMNTSGVTWEFGGVQFLQANMTPFSAYSGYNFNNNASWVFGAPGQYLNAQGTNDYHLGGYTGQAGLGNYIMADTRTVYNVNNQHSPADNRSFSATTVGTATVSPASLGLPNPSNGTADGTFSVSETDVGLTGQQIGGFFIDFYLEDVRGTSNGLTSFTASLLDFELTYIIPEPSVVVGSVLAILLVGVAIYRRRVSV